MLRSFSANAQKAVKPVSGLEETICDPLRVLLCTESLQYITDKCIAEAHFGGARKRDGSGNVKLVAAEKKLWLKKFGSMVRAQPMDIAEPAKKKLRICSMASPKAMKKQSKE